MEVWSRRSHQNGKMHLSRLLPCFILWFLWAERNRCRHNDSAFNGLNVKWQVQLQVHKLLEVGYLEPKHWQGVRLPLAIPAHSRTPIPRRFVMAVKWEPPDLPWIKINTNGIFIMNTRKASGGGVIRDHQGQLLSAFTFPLDAHSDLEADLMAMLCGIQMAMEKGTHIWVESEAAQAVALIQSDSPGPAHSRHTLVHIRLLQSKCRIRASYCYREGNKPANLLAKLSLEDSSRRCFSFGELPRTVKALIRSEQDGIPHIKTSARGWPGIPPQNHS